jgi:hypothetical protein
VARPFDRSALLPALGKLDHEAGEFWVENPWAFGSSPYNLSGFERNRLFWNVAGDRFFDLSYLSGLDSDSDSRGCVAVDLTADGMPEVLVRNAGGGPLRIYRNQAPRRHFLEVTLQGTKSNRAGIGATLVAHAGGRTIVRELYPENSYAGQRPAAVLFGLGDCTRLDRLEIDWPSGLKQSLGPFDADQFVAVVEGDARVLVRTPGGSAVPAARRD